MRCRLFPSSVPALAAALGAVSASVSARLILVGMHVTATDGLAASGLYSAAVLVGGALGGVLVGPYLHAYGVARVLRYSALLALLSQLAVIAAVAMGAPISALVPLVLSGHASALVLTTALRSALTTAGEDPSRTIALATIAAVVGGALGAIAAGVVFAAQPELLVTAGLMSLVLVVPALLAPPDGGGGGSFAEGLRAMAAFVARNWRPLAFNVVLLAVACGPVSLLAALVQQSAGSSWVGPAVLVSGLAGAVAVRFVPRTADHALTRPFLLTALATVGLLVWVLPLSGVGLIAVAAVSGAVFHAKCARLETTLVLRGGQGELGIAQGSALTVINVGLAAAALLLPAVAGPSARVGSAALRSGLVELATVGVIFVVAAYALGRLLNRHALAAA